ncbi:hypothetical protein ACFSL6_23795 [Paenibacillus thailandensis]|uniref:Multi-tm2 domain protein n=1 Tax=Paenibacillus thailandensis TaxID=393250 RepID=A0ABW5R1Z4_9BACL
MNKNPIVAFLLSFIPGAGHAYLGRPFRTLLYGGGFFGPIGLLMLLMVSGNGIGDEGAALFLFALLIAFVNMVDMIVSLVKGIGAGPSPAMEPRLYRDPLEGIQDGAGHYYYSESERREKYNTILLSFIPGLGHMNNGLMQRGITLMVAFFGLFAVIVFLSVAMDSGVLLVFLLLLPVIWAYGIFDALQQLARKQRGEPVDDRPIFADIEEHFAYGKKSRVLAMMLSFFPGAGHLYLGLQKRGLQLMAGFLLAVYLMDALRLTLFLFMIPLIICFAFFDAVQQLSRYERSALEDEPIASLLVPYQKWLGVGMVGFGVYYLLDRVVADIASRYMPNWYASYLEIKYMIPTAIVAFVMIAIGLRMLLGGRTGGANRMSRDGDL